MIRASIVLRRCAPARLTKSAATGWRDGAPAGTDTVQNRLSPLGLFCFLDWSGSSERQQQSGQCETDEN